MAHPDFFLEVVGPNAERVRQELSDLFDSEFGKRLSMKNSPEVCRKLFDGAGRQTMLGRNRVGPDVGTIAAVASLVLTIPPAILAIKDLLEWAKKKPKWEKVIECARYHYQDSRTIVRVIVDGKFKKELHRFTSAELFDIFGEFEE